MEYALLVVVLAVAMAAGVYFATRSRRPKAGPKTPGVGGGHRPDDPGNTHPR